jgi:hypothetical protein
LRPDFIGDVGSVLTEAESRADAEVCPSAEIGEESLARLTQVSVRVDDRRHRRLSREIDARGVDRQSHAGSRAHLHDPPAVDDE